MRLTRKWPEGAAVAALRDIDAVSHKKYRSACRRINQSFLNLFDSLVAFIFTMVYNIGTVSVFIFKYIIFCPKYLSEEAV